jgi:type II secretory pathway pseudopilin PulG
MTNQGRRTKDEGRNKCIGGRNAFDRRRICFEFRHSSFEFNSSFEFRSSNFKRGYTLVELFLTLIVVMILLGVMINIANRVRDQSAQRATQQILSRLDHLLEQYRKENNGQLPPISPVILPGHHLSEETLQSAALANDADLVRYLNLPALARASRLPDDPLYRNLRNTNPPLLEDSWGIPIVFMPHQDPAIGMDPRGDTFFLFSAGPDRLFLTHADNVYSYDETMAETQ